MARGGLTPRMVIASGLLTVVLVAGFVAVFLAIDNLDESTQSRRHIREEIVAANALELLAIDLETGVRGYVITREPRFLEPWTAARAAFPGEARTLEHMVAAEPVQFARVRRIVEKMRSYIRDYSVPLVNAVRRDDPSAESVAETAEGRSRVDAVRKEFDGFLATAETTLAARERSANRAERLAVVGAGVGAAGSILLVLLFVAYLSRVFVRPVRRTALMADRLAGGDLSARMPGSGIGEIGTLERSFNRMASSLEQDRAEVARLAEEQAALRRVATLVATGVPPDEIFAAVSDEVARLVGTDFASVVKFDDGPAIVFVGVASTGSDAYPLGARWEFVDGMASAEVYRTGRSARGGRDWSTVESPVGETHRRLGIVETVASPIVVEGRRWGAMTVQSHGQLAVDTEDRVEKFTELVATAIANAESRAELARLAEEQAALRRVATLVARATAPQDLFAAVTEEVGRLLGTDLAGMARYDSADTVTVLATWAAEGEHGGAHPLVPGPWPLDGGDLASMVSRTGRPVRIDDYHGASGHIAAFVRDELGVVASLASPIVVEGRLWGVLFVHSKRSGQPFPRDTESRLTGFTELVGTAIANAQARAEVARLAEQQAALRRVATLVAREASPAEVFSAVTVEVGRLVGADLAALVRFEPPDTPVVLAAWSAEEGDHVAVGTRIPVEGESVAAMVLRTGRPARRDHLEQASDSTSSIGRQLGVTSTVGTPITVERRLWGGLSVSSKKPEPLPPDTELRIADFAELVATAIANAEARTELTASRARVVAAADESRRRIERDLHDGAQQRLVSLTLELRTAHAAMPPHLPQLETALSRVAEGMTSVLDDLRDIAQGIHPAVLAEGGLVPALRTLARRSPIPVELDVPPHERLPERIEVATYYVVSETLTNAAKHSQASVVRVDVTIGDARIRVSVRDDGAGGADQARGTGLVGLKDRVESLGGSIFVESPPGAGTRVEVELPLDG